MFSLDKLKAILTVPSIKRTLSDWENDRLMEFDQRKGFVLNTSKRRKPQNNYTLKGIVLQSVDYTTYFGVETSKYLSWSRHIDKTVEKANRSLGFLKSNIQTNNIRTKTLAYQALVRRILEYSCEVMLPVSNCFPCQS